MTALNDYHRDFARAVVALAREHKMSSVSLTFRTGFYHPSGDRFGDEITATWAEGRHGDKSNISLACRASEVVDERAPAVPQADSGAAGGQGDSNG